MKIPPWVVVCVVAYGLGRIAAVHAAIDVLALPMCALGVLVIALLWGVVGVGTLVQWGRGTSTRGARPAPSRVPRH